MDMFFVTDCSYQPVFFCVEIPLNSFKVFVFVPFVFVSLFHHLKPPMKSKRTAA